MHFAEGALHDDLELFVDLAFFPEKILQVLHPLEVADGDTAGVGQDVGNDEDALAVQDVVGHRRHRAVGRLGDDLGLDVRGVLGGDDVFKRRGNEDVALELEHFLVAEARGARQGHDRAVLLLVLDGLDGVEAARVDDAAPRVADGDDLRPLLVEEPGGDAASVAEALDGYGGAAQVHALHPAGFLGDEQAPARRRLVAALGAAERDGLAGHDAQAGVAHRHRVGVHHPGHGLRVGVDVGGGDVAVGPDDGQDLGDIAARHAFQLGLRHFARVADHAALAAAEGDVHHRRLPRHPGGQRLHFIQAHIGVVADAALGRAAGDVVLHAVAFEDLERAVVHLGGDGDDHLALRAPQHLAESRFELQVVGRLVELHLGDDVGVQVFLHRCASAQDCGCWGTRDQPWCWTSCCCWIRAR